MQGKIKSYNFMVATLRKMAATRNDCKALLQDLQDKTADEIWAMIQYLPRFNNDSQVLEYLSL